MTFKLKSTARRRSVAIKLAVLAQAALLLFTGATVSAQEGNRLQDIQVMSLPGQRVELKLIMSDTAPEPLAFTIENPARIALDLPNTSLGLTSRRRDVNLGPLNTILTAEANGRTRVVLNLRYGDRYAHGHIVEDGRHLFVTSGLGTSIIPARFRVPPEIALLRLSASEW